MTSAIFWIACPPLSAFGTDLYYKIHETPLLHPLFHHPPPPFSNADFITGSSPSYRSARTTRLIERTGPFVNRSDFPGNSYRNGAICNDGEFDANVVVVVGSVRCPMSTDDGEDSARLIVARAPSQSEALRLATLMF